ncbi:helix-turn-helix domain-containing protein [Streptomyces sp. NBC_01244]|uniref:helix-turn-helix domain-containing protein n=1 Tax=Streptomyces sp. NBC_01244 TaxID=2903797 RepID=UPI002E13F77C|nr:helix-turn-helix transcriptional regulator [Streptomyces sp. NBC_01244]
MHSITPEAVELVDELRRLRAARGNPTLSAICNATGGYASVATLSRLFSGKTLPSEGAVMATARALSDDNGAQAVGELYDRARRAWQRARPWALERRPRLPVGGRARKPDTDVERFQDSLRGLVAKAGLSVRELSHLSGVPRSTLGDALSCPRPPQPRVVAAIARACDVEVGPWVSVARNVFYTSRAEEVRVVAIGEVPAPRSEGPNPEPRGGERRAEQRGADPSGFSPSGVLIEAAVTRPPAEIAALVARLKAGGETELAARLLQTAAKQRTVEDIAALALALLETEQAPASAELLPLPASRQLVVMPAKQEEHLVRLARRTPAARRASG